MHCSFMRPHDFTFGGRKKPKGSNDDSERKTSSRIRLSGGPGDYREVQWSGPKTTRIFLENRYGLGDVKMDVSFRMGPS
jgi:hypothetical protein